MFLATSAAAHVLPGRGDDRERRLEHMHPRPLAQPERRLAPARAAIRVHEARTTRVGAKARRPAAARRPQTPRGAICRIFGPHCREAVAVARCESKLRTSARNGEFRGLFQMSSTARSLFGHGVTAQAQARAAHRYFVYAGRTWSPWTCKPW